MQQKTPRLTTLASWVLFIIALTLAVGLSFVLLAAESVWGMGQVVAAGPMLVVVVVYLVTMPLIFGAVGLFKSSPNKRFVAAAVMLVSLLVYTLVALSR